MFDPRSKRLGVWIATAALGMLCRTALADNPSIPPGHRAVSVKVAPLKFPVEPGDRVNVVGFLKEGDDDHKYDVLENVVVFATNSDSGKKPGEKRTISLLVTTKDAERLVMATQHCALQLRPPSQKNIRLVDDQGKQIQSALRLTQNESQTIHLEDRVASVAVSDQALKVQAVSPTRLRIEGARAGRSTLMMKGRGWERKLEVEIVPPKNQKSPNAASGSVSVNWDFGDSRTVRLEQGATQRIYLPHPYRNLTVTNAQVVDVSPTSANVLHLTGKNPGSTRIRMEQDGQARWIDVKVAMSTTELESVLKEIFPDLDLRVVGLQSSVVLMGQVQSQMDATDIIRIAEDYYPSAISRLKVTGNATRPQPKHEEWQGRFRNQISESPERKAGIRDRAVERLTNEVKSLRRDVKQLIRLLEVETDREQGQRSRTQPRGPVDAASPPTRPQSLVDDRYELWSIRLPSAVAVAMQNEFLATYADDVWMIELTNRESSVREAEQQLCDIILAKEFAYWDLWEARANLDVVDAYHSRWAEAMKIAPDNATLATRHHSETKSAREKALAEFYEREKRLRRLLRLARTDGRLLWPVDAPSTSSTARISELRDKSSRHDSKLAELRQQQADLRNALTKAKGRNDAKRIRELQLAEAQLADQIDETLSRIDRSLSGHLTKLEDLRNALAEATRDIDRAAERYRRASPTDVDLWSKESKALYEAGLRRNSLLRELARTHQQMLKEAGILLEQHRIRLRYNDDAKQSSNRQPSNNHSSNKHSSSDLESIRANGRFVVANQQSSKVAEQIARVAHEEFESIARRWFGSPTSPWTEPCSIRWTLAQGTKTGGSTSYVLREDGRPSNRKMTLQAGDTDGLSEALTHEIAHLVLAEFTTSPPPRWLSEGFCGINESEAVQTRLREQVRQFKRTDRLHPVTRIFEADNYPSKDVLAFNAQGHSLVEFLLEVGDRDELVAFLKQGAEFDDWKAALEEIYGYESVESLEQDWLDSL